MEHSTPAIDIRNYDFVEFGASKGRSIAFAIEHLGGKRGLGIDIDSKKVRMTSEFGFDCLEADVTTLDLPDNSVRFVVMSHFLEHLPDLETVELCIKRAARIASDFLFIRGPCFDSDQYLAGLGYKYFYSDWNGHPCHLTTSDLTRILHRNDLVDFDLRFTGLTEGTLDRFIHPLTSPPNQNKYNPDSHPPKKGMRFTQAVYKEMICFVRLKEVSNWDGLINTIKDTVAVK